MSHIDNCIISLLLFSKACSNTSGFSCHNEYSSRQAQSSKDEEELLRALSTWLVNVPIVGDFEHHQTTYLLEIISPIVG